MTEWTIEDYRSIKKGYLRILRNGKRVADIFPYAANEDPERVLCDAFDLVDHANELDSP